jgi:GGDEF domain-containing protein
MPTDREFGPEYLANHDELTGLLNRRGLMNELTRMAEQKPGNFSVSFIDLDGLKQINDTMGHELGDAMLRSAGDVLSNAVRTHASPEPKGERSNSDLEDDIISAARLGGDEFVIVLVGINDQEVLNKVQQRIKHQLIENGISASIDGLPHEAGLSPQELLHKADQLMLVQKENSKKEAERKKRLDKRLAAKLGRVLLNYSGVDSSRL